MGGSALAYLMWPEKIEMVRYLLDKGIDPNIVGEIGASPLYYAVEQDVMPIVRELLNRGADPDLALRLPEEDYEVITTPLMKAAVMGNLEALQLLLDHGARIDILDERGRNALYYAERQEHEQVAEILRSAAGIP